MPHILLKNLNHTKSKFEPVLSQVDKKFITVFLNASPPSSIIQSPVVQRSLKSHAELYFSSVWFPFDTIEVPVVFVIYGLLCHFHVKFGKLLQHSLGLRGFPSLPLWYPSNSTGFCKGTPPSHGSNCLKKSNTSVLLVGLGRSHTSFLPPLLSFPIQPLSPWCFMILGLQKKDKRLSLDLLA